MKIYKSSTSVPGQHNLGAFNAVMENTSLWFGKVITNLTRSQITIYNPILGAVSYENHVNMIIEGSLEVKLPTIWRDEKQSREEA